MNKVIDKNGNEIKVEAFHPGIFLKEEIQERNISRADLGKQLGLTEQHVGNIINGKHPITVKHAFNLEQILGISAEFWLNSQLAFDIQEYRKKQSKQ